MQEWGFVSVLSVVPNSLQSPRNGLKSMRERSWCQKTKYTPRNWEWTHSLLLRCAVLVMI